LQVQLTAGNPGSTAVVVSECNQAGATPTRPPSSGQILVPLMVRREARKEMPDNMAALKQKMETGLGRQDAPGNA
jgi:hypothetical protein